MTTPRIEEIKENTPKHYAKSSTLPKQVVVTYSDFLQALTEAHQAGRDELTHSWNKAEQRLDGTAQGAVNCIEQFRNTIKALQDTK